MKKIITAAIIITVTGFSFKNINTKAATVNQVEGFFIYTDSKPVEDFIYIGTVKANTKVWYGATCYGDLPYPQLRNNLIKQAKKQFNNDGANGLIIYPDTERADVIKL